MQKTKKRILYVAMVAVLVVLQLSNALIALADSKTPLKVSDIGDKDLYAVLASACDEHGNNGGYLYKEDAENLKSLYLNMSNISDTARNIKSFDKLSEYCPNLTNISGGWTVSSDARDSFIDAVAKLDKLESVEVDVDTNAQLNKIFNKEGKENLTNLKVDFYGNSGTYDLSDIAKLTALNTLDMYKYSDSNVKNMNTISKSDSLRSLVLSYFSADDVKSVVGSVTDKLEYLSIYNSDGSNINSVDVSRLTNLTNLRTNGYVEVTGVDKLVKLNRIEINGYSYADSSKIGFDFSTIPDSVTYIEINNVSPVNGTALTRLPAKARYVTMNNCGLTDVKLSGNDYLYYLYLSNNEITEFPDLSGFPSINSLSFSGNHITDISNVKKVNGLSYLYLSDNDITDISAIAGLSDLSTLYISNNKITDISAIKNLKDLCYVDFSYNDIEALPDLSSNDNIGGSRYTYSDPNYIGEFYNTDYYRLSLAGNKLTKDAIKGKVPKECADDIYWNYMATTRSTSSHQLYFTELDTTLLSKLIEKGYNQIYTSQKDVTFDKELVSYMKKNTSNSYITLYYIDDDSVKDEVQVVKSEIAGDTESFTINFEPMEIGTNNETVNKVFSAYGEPEHYFVVKGNRDSGISGVNYDYRYVDINLEKNSGIYHEYAYDKESGTFTFVKSYNTNNGDYGNVYVSDTTAGNIHFFVKDSKDSLINTYVKRQDHVGGYSLSTYNCYTQINDDVVNGYYIREKLKLYNSFYLEKNSKVNLSKETTSKIKENKKYIRYTVYDNELEESNIQVELSPYAIKQQDINTTIPKLTKLDAASLAAPFEGGQPDCVYEIDNTADRCGITYMYRISGDRNDDNKYGYNVYKISGQAYVPVTQNTNASFMSLSVVDGAKQQYMVISSDKDTYMKTEEVKDGEYKGRTYTYLNKTDSAELEKMIKSSGSKGYSSIRVISDSLELNADTVDYMKSSGTRFSVYFVDTNTASDDSGIIVEGSNIKNAGIEGAVTLQKPEVEVSNYNEQIDKLLPEGTNALYVSNRNNMIKGASYYVYGNNSTIKKYFKNDTYTVLRLNSNGKLYTFSTYRPGSSIYLSSTVLSAYVLSSEYSTPTDTKPDDSTPSDTTPSDTEPGDKPSQDDKPTPKPPESEDDDTKKDDGKSAPIIYDKKDVIDVTEVNNKLTDDIINSKLAEIDVVSSSAPKLTSNVFSQMKEKQKDITVGVTDEDNKLQYQWKFDYDKVTQTNMDIDLSISFDTDRADAVKQITGRDDVMYLSFAHHGSLPGPATIKTYVGNQYKDGELVYLYYFNEEENRVESVGGANKGLIVKDGYVEYTITHCSLYFLSTAEAKDVNAIDLDDKNQGSGVVPVPDSVDDTTPTGDTRNVTVYIAETIAALAVMGGLLCSRKKKSRA